MRVLALAVVLCALLPAAAAAQRSPVQDARSALDSLATLHAHDGTFDAGIAPLLVEAAVALGTDPAAWPSRDHPVLASLRPAGNGTLLSQVRSIHARAVALQGTPQDRAAIEAAWHDGQFGDPALLNDDIWAIRSLRALGAPVADDYLQAAARRLLSEQHASGGWPWQVLGAPSSDMTGMALVALREADALTPEAAAAAKAYLAASRNATSSGYAETAGAANCDSTVWAIRGLQALGQGTPAGAWSYLASLHQPDGGFAYQPGQGSNPLCTAEVATLLGEWAAARRDLSAYSGPTNSAPWPGAIGLAAVLLLAARRRA